MSEVFSLFRSLSLLFGGSTKHNCLHFQPRSPLLGRCFRMHELKESRLGFNNNFCKGAATARLQTSYGEMKRAHTLHTLKSAATVYSRERRKYTRYIHLYSSLRGRRGYTSLLVQNDLLIIRYSGTMYSFMLGGRSYLPPPLPFYSCSYCRWTRHFPDPLGVCTNRTDARTLPPALTAASTCK